MNMSTDAESFEKSIRIPFRKDSFNSSRAEYSQILKKQLSQGNNGLTKTKYLTFGIEAESMRQAKPRLNHIENDLLNNFRRLGVMASTMNGKERLRLMHSMFHMGDNDKFFLERSSSVMVRLMVLMAAVWSTDWMCMVTIWLDSISRKSASIRSERSEAIICR